MRDSSFDKLHLVAVKNAHECCLGWDEIAAKLKDAIAKRRTEKPILVVDCFPGVDERTLLNELQSRLAPRLSIHAANAYHAESNIKKLIATFPGKGVPVQGDFRGLSLVNFFDAEPLWRFRRTIDELKSGLVLIVGCGASLIAWGDVFIYANLARAEARRRFGQTENGKGAFLVDAGLADRWKRPLIRRWDYVLDTHQPGEPKLALGDDVRRGLQALAKIPFPVATPSGHQDREPKYFEEASLTLGVGVVRMEIPAIDLIFNQPQALLGETVYIHFGYKFPIRFDLIDKMKSFEPFASSSGWREERATLKEGPTIEARRHRLTKTVKHDTHGRVNVLALVEGEEAILESPDHTFEPLIVRHSEKIVVPAGVRRYNIRPHGPAVNTEISTVKAFVRI